MKLIVKYFAFFLLINLVVDILLNVTRKSITEFILREIFISLILALFFYKSERPFFNLLKKWKSHKK